MIFFIYNTSQWWNIYGCAPYRKQAVVVEGETSDYINVESVVPQGSVFGPSLFLYYFNDMPENIKSTVRLFADDRHCLPNNYIRCVQSTPAGGP